MNDERRMGPGEGAAWTLAITLALAAVPIDVLDSLIDPNLVVLSSGCSAGAALAMIRAVWCRRRGR